MASKTDVSAEPTLISLIDLSSSISTNCNDNTNTKKLNEKEKKENEIKKKNSLITELENLKFSTPPNFDLD